MSPKTIGAPSGQLKLVQSGGHTASGGGGNYNRPPGSSMTSGGGGGSPPNEHNAEIDRMKTEITWLQRICYGGGAFILAGYFGALVWADAKFDSQTSRLDTIIENVGSGIRNVEGEIDINENSIISLAERYAMITNRLDDQDESLDEIQISLGLIAEQILD